MKKKNLKSLILNKKSISKFNYQLKGGANTFGTCEYTDECIDTCFCTKITMAIRCGHTIGNGQDENGNPCTI